MVCFLAYTTFVTNIGSLSTHSYPFHVALCTKLISIPFLLGRLQTGYDVDSQHTTPTFISK